MRLLSLCCYQVHVFFGCCYRLRAFPFSSFSPLIKGKNAPAIAVLLPSACFLARLLQIARISVFGIKGKIALAIALLLPTACFFGCCYRLRAFPFSSFSPLIKGKNAPAIAVPLENACFLARLLQIAPHFRFVVFSWYKGKNCACYISAVVVCECYCFLVQSIA